MNSLNTKFGPIQFEPTVANHIYVQTEGLVVNRVQYRGHLHFYLNIQGKFTLTNPETGKTENNFLNRPWTDSTSRTAGEQMSRKNLALVEAEVGEKLTGWASLNPHELMEAQKKYVSEQHLRNHEKIKELQKQIDALEAEGRKLYATLDQCPACKQTRRVTGDVRLVNSVSGGSHPYCQWCKQVLPEKNLQAATVQS